MLNRRIKPEYPHNALFDYRLLAWSTDWVTSTGNAHGKASRSCRTLQGRGYWVTLNPAAGIGTLAGEDLKLILRRQDRLSMIVEEGKGCGRPYAEYPTRP